MNFVLGLLITILTRSAFGSTTPGLDSFKTTLHPALRQTCASCHGDGGLAIGHSVKDVSVAYKLALRYVDFADLSQSLFVKMAQRRHWLRYDPQAKGMSETEMIKHLKAWWENGESETTPSFGYESSAQPIPTSLPTIATGHYERLAWPLTFPILATGACELSVDIQLASPTTKDHAGSYRLSSPTLSCRSIPSSFQIKGLYFPVSSDVAAFENSFKDVQWRVPEGESVRVLSNLKMIVLSRSPSDTIAFKLRFINSSPR